MKCNFCNTDIQDDVKFCPSCGAVASAEANNAEDQPQQTTDSNAAPNQTYGYGEQPQGQQPYNQQNAYYAQQGPKINGTTYLVFSILVTLLCCLPLGIASIIYATKINSLQAAGDYMGAQEAAKKAKLFIILSVVLGIVFGVIYGIFTVVGMGSYYY